MDANWLQSSTGFQSCLREKSLRVLLSFSDSLLKDEGTGLGNVEDFLMLQQPITNQFGILVCEEWRASKSFRLYELDPTPMDAEAKTSIAEAKASVARAWEWTPGNDINSVDNAMLGKRFSIKSKHLRNINIQDCSWYPVRVLQHAVVINGNVKSFLNIFDELESVRQAYCKLSGLCFSVLDDSLSYQQSPPCTLLSSEENAAACSLREEISPSKAVFTPHDPIHRGDVQAFGEQSDTESLVSSKSMDSPIHGKKNTSLSDTDSEIDDEDSVQILKGMDLGDEHPFDGHVETESESCNEEDLIDNPCNLPGVEECKQAAVESEVDLRKFCTEHCKLGRKWNGNLFNIQCAVCKQWFHGNCIGVKKGHVGRKDTWVCSRDCEDDLPLCGRISTVICGATVHDRYSSHKARSVKTGIQPKIRERNSGNTLIQRQEQIVGKASDRVNIKTKERIVKSVPYISAQKQANVKESNQKLKSSRDGEKFLDSQPLCKEQENDLGVGVKEACTTSRRPSINQDTVVSKCTLECICGEPNDNRFMIKCCACGARFHGDCVGLSNESMSRELPWICSEKCELKLSSNHGKFSECRPENKEVLSVNYGSTGSGEKMHSDSVSEALYCVSTCKFGRKEGEDFMIECSSCKQWFHGECVEVIEDTVPAEAAWVCCLECEEDLPISARKEEVIIGSTKGRKRSKVSSFRKKQKKYQIGNVVCPEPLAADIDFSSGSLDKVDINEGSEIAIADDATHPVSTESLDTSRSAAQLCLPQALAFIVGKSSASRPEVMRSVLNYVTENELLDVDDPAYIIVDDALQEIVGIQAKCKLSKLAKKVTKLLKNAVNDTPANTEQIELAATDTPKEMQMKRRLDLVFQEDPLCQDEAEVRSLTTATEVNTHEPDSCVLDEIQPKENSHVDKVKIELFGEISEPKMSKSDFGERCPKRCKVELSAAIPMNQNAIPESSSVTVLGSSPKRKNQTDGSEDLNTEPKLVSELSPRKRQCIGVDESANAQDCNTMILPRNSPEDSVSYSNIDSNSLKIISVYEQENAVSRHEQDCAGPGSFNVDSKAPDCDDLDADDLLLLEVRIITAKPHIKA